MEADAAADGRGPDEGLPWREAAARILPALSFPESRKLFDHWHQLGDSRRRPGRQDLNPAEIARVLTHVWLMDYLADARRLRYRLVGDEIRNRYDFPLVGKHLDEIVDPEVYPRVSRYFLACVEMPAVALLAGRLFHEWRQPGHGERMLLPLFAADGQPEGLIGMTICTKVYQSRSEAQQESPRRLHLAPLDGAEMTVEDA